MVHRPGPEPVPAPRLAALDGLDDWRYLLDSIQATFTAADYAAAAALVAAVAGAAEAADHHPDVDLRYPGTVRVVLTTHATGSVTTADVDLARTVSALAAAAGAVARPERAAATELAIDAMDVAAVRPFWAAVLGYRDVDGYLVDPLGRGPAVWFQQMDAPRPQRNRIHVDVVVAHDVAEGRVAAALAAGGTLVSDARARAWWVLADAEGNEACVSTWQDRD
ncbi:VOC family protein [Pseudonocardia humida]|uniref:Putative pterin-4-alpha-carbinolamine dehydratase n=1 Tax=Pseudonocardia humida TaxID=2800819 RepID=A0ABT0ZSB6_9PSEU|nr:VOC family protein [Pseudonocardia humida]MCO1653620.1 4a-hydroxytetrahydrobiopterin dehydratase [Pseudonocardia humida]